MENPPLWIWAIVVGLIIAGKYAYRWKTTKQLTKGMERREKTIGLSKNIHSLNHAYPYLKVFVTKAITRTCRSSLDKNLSTFGGPALDSDVKANI
jgi:hypothetical protein